MKVWTYSDCSTKSTCLINRSIMQGDLELALEVLKPLDILHRQSTSADW